MKRQPFRNPQCSIKMNVSLKAILTYSDGSRSVLEVDVSVVLELSLSRDSTEDLRVVDDELLLNDDVVTSFFASLGNLGS